MKKSMTVTYEVDGGLYVNLTNRCPNRCDFCIRNNGDGAYGSDPLWLLHEPTEKQTLADIFSRGDIAVKYRELVFCGYGEPTCRIDTLISVAKEVKRRFPSLQIRVNTNGEGNLINGRDIAPDFSGVIDFVSVSLNTPDAEEYTALCHPVYGNSAFPAILDFAREVKKYVPVVAFSVVRQTLTEEQLKRCYDIAAACGVSLRVRELIK